MTRAWYRWAVAVIRIASQEDRLTMTTTRRVVVARHPVIDPVLDQRGPGLVGHADDRHEQDRERAEVPVAEDQRAEGQRAPLSSRSGS